MLQNKIQRNIWVKSSIKILLHVKECKKYKKLKWSSAKKHSCSAWSLSSSNLVSLSRAEANCSAVAGCEVEVAGSGALYVLFAQFQPRIGLVRLPKSPVQSLNPPASQRAECLWPPFLKGAVAANHYHKHTHMAHHNPKQHNARLSTCSCLMPRTRVTMNLAWSQMVPFPFVSFCILLYPFVSFCCLQAWKPQGFCKMLGHLAKDLGTGALYQIRISCMSWGPQRAKSCLHTCSYSGQPPVTYLQQWPLAWKSWFLSPSGSSVIKQMRLTYLRS